MECLTIDSIMCDNKVIIGFWEESHIEGDIIPDGCSIHLTDGDRQEYLESVYSKRTDDIPDNYERVVDNTGYIGYISDTIYDKLVVEKTIRVTQVELRNLMHLEEVVVEYL